MKRISTLDLQPGMIAAESIFDLSHTLILEKGTELTDVLIMRLQDHTILEIYVEEKLPVTDSDKAEFSVVASTDEFPDLSLSVSQRIKQSEEFKAFKAEYDLNLSSFKDAINNVVEKNVALDVNELLHNSLEIVTSNRGHFSVLDMLQNMRDYDDSTFAHCMNVALISNVLAGWLRLSPEDVEMATACGLFHDIGKLMIPHQIITKPGKLSNEEYNEVRKHTIEGYQLLKAKNVDIHIQNAALMHHERSDGTGYPLRIAGEKIDRFARIVAIADVYDAMTAARCYRGPLCPFTVIEMFEKEGFQKYEVAYLITFLENVVNTYLRNRCKLSDGREAEIVFINKDKLSRPMVICEGQYISLADYPDLTIECIL